MLKEIIDYINCKLIPLKITGKPFGLCEIIKNGELSFPAIYDLGEYKKIHDIDFNDGVIYHRIRSQYTESNNDEASTTGCDKYIDRTYYLRCVVICRKNIKGDNQYSDEKIASIISKNINFRNDRELRISLKIDSIDVNISSFNTNRDEVFSQEFKGLEQFINYEYCLIAVDYNLVIGSDISCFENC